MDLQMFAQLLQGQRRDIQVSQSKEAVSQWVTVYQHTILQDSDAGPVVHALLCMVPFSSLGAQ